MCFYFSTYTWCAHKYMQTTNTRIHMHWHTKTTNTSQPVSENDGMKVSCIRYNKYDRVCRATLNQRRWTLMFRFVPFDSCFNQCIRWSLSVNRCMCVYVLLVWNPRECECMCMRLSHSPLLYVALRCCFVSVFVLVVHSTTQCLCVVAFFFFSISCTATIQYCMYLSSVSNAKYAVAIN